MIIGKRMLCIFKDNSCILFFMTESFADNTSHERAPASKRNPLEGLSQEKALKELRDWEVYILMQAESGVFGTSAHEQYLLYLDYYNQQYAKEHGSYEAQITTLEEAKEEFARIQTDAKERFDNAKPRIAPND